MMECGQDEDEDEDVRRAWCVVRGWEEKTRQKQRQLRRDSAAQTRRDGGCG